MKKQKLESKYRKWDVVCRYQISKIKHQNEKDNIQKIINTLLKNRGIETEKQKEEFLNPTRPEKIEIKDTGINEKSIIKVIRRIKLAQKEKQKTIIFGDYDVDGVTSSAIIWQYLYSTGLDVLPYIPDRFSEGYGIKPGSIEELHKKYPDLKLIITVDNGIIAFEAIKKAGELGIDVIVIDHHQKSERYPDAYAIIHTTKLCGAGISWFLIRELSRIIHNTKYVIHDFLELAALGTVADQMKLTGINRSIVKYGLEELNNTKSAGLNALIDISGIKKGAIGVYEINYMIAPRLNAMGRIEHAIDSLRLLCTRSSKKAFELAELLNRTNARRQKTVDEVVERVKIQMSKKSMGKIIVLDGDYHEGVIGLAASKLVDEFFRPAIVISKGETISKGSARSIPGFVIIDAIRSAGELLLGGGGHEMAAGFSIHTKDLKKFGSVLEKYAEKNIDISLLEKKLKSDSELTQNDLSRQLVSEIRKMEPFGIGNPTPLFVTYGCVIDSVKKVGRSGNHIKFTLKKTSEYIEAVIFNCLNELEKFENGMKVDLVYNLEENYWNGNVTLQMKVKDVRDSTEIS